VLVVFLVVLWVGVLTPLVIRWVRAGATSHSVDSFHKGLDQLGAATPRALSRNRRNEEEEVDIEEAIAQARAALPPRQPQVRILDRPVRRPTYEENSFTDDVGSEAQSGTTNERQIRRRRQQLRRRRFTLVSLGMVFFGLLLGAVAGIPAFFAVFAVGLIGVALVVAGASMQTKKSHTSHLPSREAPPRPTYAGRSFAEDEPQITPNFSVSRFIDQDFVEPDEVTVDLRAERTRRNANVSPSLQGTAAARSGLPGAWDETEPAANQRSFVFRDESK